MRGKVRRWSALINDFRPFKLQVGADRASLYESPTLLFVACLLLLIVDLGCSLHQASGFSVGCSRDLRFVSLLNQSPDDWEIIQHLQNSLCGAQS